MPFTLLHIVAPLLSLAILILGNGLLLTLVTLRLHLADESVWMIGVMSAAFYAGLAVGAMYIHKFVYRVGHIRAYAAFAAALTVVTLIQGLWVNHFVWIFLRFLGGLYLAGLFVVIESWLLGYSTVENRGRVLAFYMIALYGAQSMSQFLLNVSDPMSIIPFCLIAILSALSIVPVSATYHPSPPIEEPSTLSFKKLYTVSPLGVVGCFIGGLVLSAVYGFFPLFLSELEFSVSQLAFVMGIVIFGGMVLQYPVGRLSDLIDRRKVLVGLCGFIILLSIGQMVFAYYSYIIFVSIAFLFGGMAFTLYPISTSHACDHLEVKDIAAGTGGLLFAYSIGATIGPLIVPFFMRPIGPLGFFVYFMVVTSLLAVFAIWRMRQRAAVSIDEKQEFVPVPAGVTPLATELDPRLEVVEQEEKII